MTVSSAPGTVAPSRPPGDLPTTRLLLPASALLWGTQFAFLTPAIGIILAALYGASATEIGVALAAYNSSAFVATLVVPTRADRSGDYLRPLVWCGVFTIALVTALAVAPTLPLAVLALVALGGPAGVAVGLIFAHQRHTGATADQVMRTRAIFSLAWVGGPPLAAFIIGTGGSRAVLWSIAGLGLLGLGLTRLMQSRHARSRHAAAPPPVGDRMSVVLRRPAVIALLATFVLLLGSVTASVAVMPLYVTEELGLHVEWSGIALGTCAALEIPLLLSLGRLTARFGPWRLVALGSVAGLTYYLLMLTVGGQVVLVGGQLLNATYIATVSGLGLTIYQDVVGRPGLASSLFMNTTRVGAIVAGPVLALGGASVLGYTGVFLGCALLVVLGGGVLVASRGIARRRAHAGGSTSGVLTPSEGSVPSKPSHR
ncbi:MFS transporter [Phycicoccus sp. CSK15P-2]|uniref:MFS transporter n=1 Tax=Phycicoccus sp. CSK15P-2 TaxID=2807627 RepID=UPI00195252EB|nr:MFS transporter [Phycicoccus sp. CSK15P-2]MBM6405038.1 MFS transporter [Phycicoccus sp. CSK15P-2]